MRVAAESIKAHEIFEEDAPHASANRTSWARRRSHYEGMSVMQQCGQPPDAVIHPLHCKPGWDWLLTRELACRQSERAAIFGMVHPLVIEGTVSGVALSAFTQSCADGGRPNQRWSRLDPKSAFSATSAWDGSWNVP